MVPAPPPAFTCKLPGPWPPLKFRRRLLRCSYLRSPFLSAVLRELLFGNLARSVRDRSRIPLSRRTPRPGCSAERELFDWSYCRKAKLRPAPLLPQRTRTSFRAYRGSIELVSNATRMASMRRNRKRLLRIFSAFFLVAYRNSTDADEPHALQHGIELAISHRAS